MANEFQIGDLVKVNESLDLLSDLRRYVGCVGRVFHAETVMSPYSGQISQAIGVRFEGFPRHISENASWFVKAAR